MTFPLTFRCLLALLPAAVLHGSDRGAWVPLFDGRSLDGWEVHGGTATYRVEDGVIVGTTSPTPSINTFLCTSRSFGDFELQLEVKCDDALNSGIQIRSHVYGQDTPQASQPDRMRKRGEVYGYQCEIAADPRCTAGNFWDEGRWTKWHDDLTGRPGACAAYRPGEWNQYRIVAQGDRIRSWVNGVACADFRDPLDSAGFIGLQVHRIRAPHERSFQVRFRAILIRELRPDQPVE